MYLVEDLYREHGEALGLDLVAGKDGLKRKITVAEAHRPGLSLSGYLKGHAAKRLLVFGKVEIEYLRDLDPSVCHERLIPLMSGSTPAAIVARGYRPPAELVAICDEKQL